VILLRILYFTCDPFDKEGAVCEAYSKHESEEKFLQKFWSSKLKGRYHLKDLDVDG
jgi:hypothetical protein